MGIDLSSYARLALDNRNDKDIYFGDNNKDNNNNNNNNDGRKSGYWKATVEPQLRAFQ